MEHEVEVLVLDPYCGQINPGTTAGRSSLNKATESAENSKFLCASVENLKKVQTNFEDLASKFI